jgi:hypothetical protein
MKFPKEGYQWPDVCDDYFNPDGNKGNCFKPENRTNYRGNAKERWELDFTTISALSLSYGLQ